MPGSASSIKMNNGGCGHRCFNCAYCSNDNTMVDCSTYGKEVDTTNSHNDNAVNQSNINSYDNHDMSDEIMSHESTHKCTDCALCNNDLSEADSTSGANVDTTNYESNINAINHMMTNMTMDSGCEHVDSGIQRTNSNSDDPQTQFTPIKYPRRSKRLQNKYNSVIKK